MSRYEDNLIIVFEHVSTHVQSKPMQIIFLNLASLLWVVLVRGLSSCTLALADPAGWDALATCLGLERLVPNPQMIFK